MSDPLSGCDENAFVFKLSALQNSRRLVSLFSLFIFLVMEIMSPSIPIHTVHQQTLTQTLRD